MKVISITIPETLAVNALLLMQAGMKAVPPGEQFDNAVGVYANFQTAVRAASGALAEESKQEAEEIAKAKKLVMQADAALEEVKKKEAELVNGAPAAVPKKRK